MSIRCVLAGRVCLKLQAALFGTLVMGQSARHAHVAECFMLQTAFAAGDMVAPVLQDGHISHMSAAVQAAG